MCWLLLGSSETASICHVTSYRADIITLSFSVNQEKEANIYLSQMWNHRITHKLSRNYIFRKILLSQLCSGCIREKEALCRRGRTYIDYVVDFFRNPWVCYTLYTVPIAVKI